VLGPHTIGQTQFTFWSLLPPYFLYIMVLCLGTAFILMFLGSLLKILL